MAVKKKEIYRCASCGYESVKWVGQCPACHAWNQMNLVEDLPRESAGLGNASGTQAVRAVRPDRLKRLSDIRYDGGKRLVTGISEFDRVLGGGIIMDSMSILAARPGAGKSTLLLQVAQKAAEQGCRVLYASGEESEGQIRRRAERILPHIHEKIFVLSTSSMNEVLGAIYDTDPQLIIMDSIQTFALAELSSRPGSPTQTMECTSALLGIAKNPQKPRAVFLTGQLTKEDELAGVRALEHMVDTVLAMDADENEELRMLTASKNRFGSTGEIGFFLMEEQGLLAIDNPSEYFMTQRSEPVTGSALTVLKEGTRPVIAEVESLISQSFTPYPSRIAECMRRDQLNTLISILEQRGRLPLYDKNVVLKTTGGIKLTEQSVNLAVLVSLASSVRETPLPVRSVYIGDVGLTGELKKVPSMELRLREAERLGFTDAYVAEGAVRPDRRNQFTSLKIHEVRHIFPLLRELFGGWNVL
ncbi:MAG: DNA repair protein RadA [Firmicutes bacterium]|nr:DNA repair protein RadA [Bacillota bacterium]